MDELINWSQVSRMLTNGPGDIRKTYSGTKYKEVISDIREIAKLIELRIESEGDKTSSDVLKELDELIKE